MDTLPNEAIDPKTLDIDNKKCLRCFACVRICKSEARRVVYKKEALVNRFLNNVNKHRKEPHLCF